MVLQTSKPPSILQSYRFPVFSQNALPDLRLKASVSLFILNIMNINLFLI